MVERRALRAALVLGDAVCATSLAGDELIRLAPRGAYTTMRSFRRHALFEFELHVRRTANSAKLMMLEEGEGDLYPSVTSPAGLREMFVESLAKGIRYYESEVEASHDRNGELKLTVLVVWGAPRVALTYAALLPANGFVKPDAAAAAPFLLVSHIAPMKQRAQPPITVTVHEGPRHNPAAKDSDWVRERAAIEASMPKGTEDVVLADSAGNLLEGTQTNFFCVNEAGVVCTAVDGVLLGTVRALVLETCVAKGIPVSLAPPNLSRIATWRGAFLTSTSRLVLPVDTVMFAESSVPPTPSSAAAPGGGAGGIPTAPATGMRSVSFPVDPLIRRIEALVEAAVGANSTAIM